MIRFLIQQCRIQILLKYFGYHFTYTNAFRVGYIILKIIILYYHFTGNFIKMGHSFYTTFLYFNLRSFIKRIATTETVLEINIDKSKVYFYVTDAW